jgi:cytochrome b subunit of formate dehydrogenase
MSVHHVPNAGGDGIVGRGLQKNEWPMGNITMQGLHALFETSNLPHHHIKEYLAFLSSPFFQKEDLCDMKTYKKNVKKARTNAVRIYYFVFVILCYFIFIFFFVILFFVLKLLN